MQIQAFLLLHVPSFSVSYNQRQINPSFLSQKYQQGSHHRLWRAKFGPHFVTVSFPFMRQARNPPSLSFRSCKELKYTTLIVVILDSRGSVPSSHGVAIPSCEAQKAISPTASFWVNEIQYHRRHPRFTSLSTILPRRHSRFTSLSTTPDGVIPAAFCAGIQWLCFFFFLQFDIAIIPIRVPSP